MTAIIKTSEQIEKMRVAGRLAAEVLEMIEPYIKAGVSTGELDRICHDYIVNVQQAIPAPLNYHGFPKSICTSVNHVICHGIPQTTNSSKTATSSTWISRSLKMAITATPRKCLSLANLLFWLTAWCALPKNVCIWV